MLIAVVSDTHGHVEFTRQAVEVMEKFKIATVVHCGDIGSASVIPLFDRWPTHFVFGNVDYDEASLRTAIEAAQQTCHDRFGTLTLEETKIAFLHSDDGGRFLQTIGSESYDLVCYGHTHVAKTHREGKTTVLNPGALYRASPRSFSLVELPSLEITQIRL
ncbi:MAG: YfcE family phosphodiesterase [Planctomycetes bacterium]|nr:YfcE family phosphodiesterase [Planctomycetota bacterium]